MALDLLIQEAQGLSEEALMEVVRFMKFIKAESTTQVKPSVNQQDKIARKAGLYRGEIWMSEDFDAPLDEFREYM